MAQDANPLTYASILRQHPVFILHISTSKESYLESFDKKTLEGFKNLEYLEDEKKKTFLI